METDIIIGVDLAKNVFQVHGANRSGAVLFRKKLSRPQFMKFMTAQPGCLVAMGACSTSYYWARTLSDAGHDVRLIPPIYVKPFVKRHKNDAADAEAIVEAARHPNMSFVEPKSADKQALSMMMRTRDQLIDYSTATVNALRGHMAAFGLIVPVGIKNIERLQELVAADDALPSLVSEMASIHFEQIIELTRQVDRLTEKIKTYSTSNATVRRLQTMPGIGPIGAMIIETFAPDMATFKRGRDFAAWLGLIPLQKSTGGKSRLGQITKMGQKDIRRALVIGAMSRIAGYARQKSCA
ncbi:MAG: IS110 family transposase, partial [Candidatus Puniceispirillaceae bacterium]